MINSVSPDLNTIKDAEPLARLQLQKRMTEQTMPLSFAGETDPPTRQDRVRRALFRGESLRLLHLHYRHLVWALATLLLEDEWNPHDLTNIALAPAKKVEMAIIAHERGVVAGVAETAWLFGQFGLDAESKKTDGDMFGAGDTLLRIQGNARTIFSLERLGLDLLQRMCGIATATREIQNTFDQHSANTLVIATHKKACSLLDKRAVECGAGGTHRLGLGDAILIETNHLQLWGDREQETIPWTLRRAWAFREQAAFIEIEVTSQDSALAAARTFQSLQRADKVHFPCLVLLNNMHPAEVTNAVAALKAAGVWHDVLLEAGGEVVDTQIDAYADCGVDAVSVGRLTHSPRALDLRLKLDPLLGDGNEPNQL